MPCSHRLCGQVSSRAIPFNPANLLAPIRGRKLKAQGNWVHQVQSSESLPLSASNSVHVARIVWCLSEYHWDRHPRVFLGAYCTYFGFIRCLSGFYWDSHNCLSMILPDSPSIFQIESACGSASNPSVCMWVGQQSLSMHVGRAAIPQYACGSTGNPSVCMPPSQGVHSVPGVRIAVSYYRSQHIYRARQ